jgi:putative ABC transport system permease protein
MKSTRTFAATVIATLSIATAVTAVVGSIVDRVLIRPLPFSNARRVVGVWFASPNLPGGLTRVRQSKATYLHVLENATSFEYFALAEESTLTLDAGERPTRLRGAQVTASIFDVLGIKVGLGRRFDSRDNAPGAEPVVLLSDTAWRARFGADGSILGRSVRIDGVTHRIVGVLGSGLRFPASETDLWVPLLIDPANLDGQDFVYTGYGLVKPGVTPEAMQADMGRAIGRLPDAYPETFPRPLLNRLELSGLFVPLLEEIVGPVRRPLLFALGATALVLLTVFANLTNLFILRRDGRQLEIAIRSTMGALPGRLARTDLQDTLIYAVTGGLLGLGLAIAALGWVREAAVGVLPRAHEIALDPRTAVLCVATTIGLGLLAGLATLWRSPLRNVEALRGGDRTGATRRSASLRWLLVGGQVALSVVAATGAGLLVRSATALAAIDPGFRPEGLGGARLFLPASDYPAFSSVVGFYSGLVDQLREVSGVTGAAAVTYLPLRDGRILYPYRIEGDPREDALPSPRQTKLVLDGYFETMGIPVLAGRTIERRDIGSDSDAVVVNAAFAQAHWPGSRALGRRIRTDVSGPWLTVTGIVGNELDRHLTDEAPPIVYLPYQARHAIDRRLREMSIVVRGTRGEATLSLIRDVVARRDRAVPVSDARSMTDVVAAATARTRYAMRLAVVCAISVLFLAALGLYVVLSESVASRLKEVAIRMALGATVADIRTMILTRVGVTLAAGGLAGAAIAATLARLAARLFFGVPAVDPVTIGAVALLVGFSGWVTTLGPARRAAAVPPALLLRTSR